MNSYVNRYRETIVGAGYYALRPTKYGSKLVKADRSPTISLNGKGIPKTGHNPRRQRILDKRNLAKGESK